MNNRIPLHYFPGFIFILILFFGCELNEDVIRKENYADKIKIREASLDKLLAESKFLAAYNKVYSNRDKSRTAMEAQYNFGIIPYGAKVIEDGGKTSYTFKITREINNPDYFENLVINVDSLGLPSAYILKYTPVKSIEPSDHESFHFEGDVRITPIVYNISQTGKDIVCITANVMMCNQSQNGGLGVEHVAGKDCQTSMYLYEVKVTTCDVGGGGGSFGAGAGQYTGGNNTGGQTGNGGGGDGSPPTDGELTPPNNCPRCPIFVTAPVEDIDPATQTPSTPCNHLKNLTASPAVKGTFKTLDGRKNQDGEWGYGFQTQNNTSNSIKPPNVIEASYNDPNKLNMQKAIGGNYIGASHTHPHISYGYYPMFSYDDLQYLMQVGMKHDNGGKPKDWTKYVLTLTAYEGIFAIKIKDPIKFFAAMGQNGNKIKNRIQDDYRALPTGASMDTFKKTFLNILADFDLGAGLYEGSIDLSAPDLASTNFNWGELSQNKGKIVNTPCP